MPWEISLDIGREFTNSLVCMVFHPFHWVFQEEKERKGRDYGRIM
jgi:hypothetical protein